MESITFRVDDGKVKRLTTTVYAECADATRQRIRVEKGRTEIAGDRFSLALGGASDLKATVSGKLRGGRAAGRIEVSVKPPGTSLHGGRALDGRARQAAGPLATRNRVAARARAGCGCRAR